MIDFKNIKQNYILEHRARKGWTQAELAKRLGVSKVTIYNWEKQHNQPLPPTIIRLMAVLDCGMEDLFLRT